jgi:hypothetical protein
MNLENHMKTLSGLTTAGKLLDAALEQTQEASTLIY